MPDRNIRNRYLRDNQIRELIQQAVRYRSEGNYQQAEHIYKKILAQKPDDKTAAIVNNNLAYLFFEREQFDEAIRYFRIAIRHDPKYGIVYSNLGYAYHEKGQFDEAIASYETALHIDPDNAGAHWNLSFSLLLTGNMQRGWEEYEWRWKLDNPYKRNFSQPVWNGSHVEGLTLLLHTEQGFGDSIQFIRYAPLMKQRGARVLVESQQEVVSLLKNMEGIEAIMPQGTELPAFDLYCPLLSLPFLFKTDFGTIPRNVPYITVDPALLEKWKAKISHYHAEYKIGLAWSAGGLPRKKSFALGVFAPLSEIRGVTFFSLQKGSETEQAKAPPRNMLLVDLMDEIEDFSETAALIENLDLVISVDTAVAHLAGALGKPVWILLPYVPEWRWLLHREDSPWYPTTRLFRQPSRGDWDSVIQTVADALQCQMNDKAQLQA